MTIVINKKQTRKGYKMKYSIVGIEVETVNVNYNELRSQMPSELKKYIEIKYDGSLGNNGAEIAFCPLYMNDQAYQAVQRVLCALIDLGCDINVKCGVHIHVCNRSLKENVTGGDFNNASMNNWFTSNGNRSIVDNMLNDEPMDFKLVQKIMLRYTEQQDVINSMFPPSRTNCRWSRPLNIDRIKRATNIQDLKFGKYSTINLDPWINDTIEFRQSSGTLELSKIKAWIKLILNAFQWSLDNHFSTGGGMQTVRTPDRHPSRRNSRIGIVYQAIRTENGATVRELMNLCGNTANNIRRLVSELRNEFGDNSIITHTQQANNHSYGDGEEFSGYTMLEEYTIPSEGLTPLPENRSGNNSIWSGLDDNTFEFLHDRIEEIASRS
jgi:hypothetical protein